MCAINGCSGTDQALMERMLAVTKHRGPDGSRIYTDEGVSFGFNRLAIIDLSEQAMHPIWDASKRYALMQNGEIYNYRELRKELADYPFTTEGDTEVILAAYLKWGEEAFNKLNGMFAIALWDTKEKKLILARDRAGVKPLYYAYDGARLVFSSDVAAILETGMPRHINQDALGHYLRLMYVPQEMTLIEGVHKLAPGHVLTYRDSRISIASLVQETASTKPRTYRDAVKAVREAVEAGVQRQLVSDRPVGLYLSGGIDSTAILAAATNVHPAINTYSVGYALEEGEEAPKFNADADLASMSAEHFGATHHEYRLTAADAAALFDEMIMYSHEPVGNATALAQLFLARETKPTATVVLSGEGGDELFGGYERYRMSLIAGRMSMLFPQMLGTLLPTRARKGFLRGVDRYAQLMYQKDTEVAPLLKTPLPDTSALFRKYFGTMSDVVGLMRADEENWLVDEALLRADAMGMGASVEARVPFLDNRVRDLAHALPLGYKVTTGATKRVLKDAFRDVLPKEILCQPKRGWFSPGAKWLRRPEFVARAEEIFAPNYTEISALFDNAVLQRLWEEHRSQKAYHFTELWAVMVVLAWARHNKVTL